MASAPATSVIFLLVLVAAGSSEELQGFSPFSFIKEIMHFLGDSSDGFDISSYANRRPLHGYRVPYNNALPPGLGVSVNKAPSQDTLHALPNESQLSLKLVAEPYGAAGEHSNILSASLPKGQDPPSLMPLHRQTSTTEPILELHLIPGPPYSSENLLGQPSISQTSPKSSGKVHGLPSFHTFYYPSSDTQRHVTHERRQFLSPKNTITADREKAPDTVSDASTSHSPLYVEHVTIPRPQYPDEQATTAVPRVAAPRLNEVNPPGEPDVSRDHTEQTLTRNSTSQLSVHAPPVQSSQEQINIYSGHIEEFLPSSNESSNVPDTPETTASGNSHIPPYLKTQDPYDPLHSSSSNMPDLAYTDIPESSSAEDNIPEINMRNHAMYLPENPQDSSKNEYGSSGRTQISQEIIEELPSKTHRTQMRSHEMYYPEIRQESSKNEYGSSGSTHVSSEITGEIPSEIYKSNARKHVMHLPENRHESSKNEYGPFGRTHASSEITGELPSEPYKSGHGYVQGQFHPVHCSHSSLPHPPRGTEAVLAHKAKSEDCSNSRILMESPPQPVLVQQRAENEMPSKHHRPETAAPKDASPPVSGLSPAAMQVFTYPRQSNMPYFDPRPQVPEIDPMSYFFGSKGIRPVNTCRTCQRLGQYYHLVPMQPIQTM